MEGSTRGELIDLIGFRERKGRLGFPSRPFVVLACHGRFNQPVQGSFFNSISLNWTFMGGPAWTCKASTPDFAAFAA